MTEDAELLRVQPHCLHRKLVDGLAERAGRMNHRRVHSETGHPPLQRWHGGGPFPLPTPAALAEAFLWEAHRTVSKTALVSLQGNTYQVDPLLVGHRVELVFDPFDLTTVTVRLHGVGAGTAIQHRPTHGTRKLSSPVLPASSVRPQIRSPTTIR